MLAKLNTYSDYFILQQVLIIDGRETFHLQASRELFFHDRDSLKWLTYVRRQKSSSQSDKPPFSLYFPLVRPLFYRFINGRPNGSPDFGYESVTP